jgi:integrase
VDAQRPVPPRQAVAGGCCDRPAGLSPHELRRTAASLAISAGANVKAVQRTLGHASAEVTLNVDIDLFDDLDDVAMRLDHAQLR